MQDTNMKFAHFTAFIDALRRTNPRLAEQVQWLLGPEPSGQPRDVFGGASERALEGLRARLPAHRNPIGSVVWPISNPHLTATRYMPIRAFRGLPLKSPALFAPTPIDHTVVDQTPVDNLRIFLSSGTTSGPEGRSVSKYSTVGLDLYQAASVATFYSALSRCLDPITVDLMGVTAVSLIPTASQWPDSSLAQMMAWFAEIWSTHYADADDVAHVQKSIELATKGGNPIFVFGTAFHFVNLLESKATFRLPAGSLVIETGGTKGRSRSVTRDELYQLIASGFGIDQSRIVSEYGMCELASQAWDVVDIDQDSSLQNRTFKFPWWVTSAVMTTHSEADATGEGALTIYDPLRLDVGNVALQTEDLARVASDQSFQLLGRVPRAPLKGCSLRVTEVTSVDISVAHKTASKAIGNFATTDRALVSENSARAHQWFLRLLADDVALTRLTRELADATLARQAIEDLSASLPPDDSDFVTAAANATSHASTTKNWLLIPPSSHSLALIQPLAVALTLGLSLRVRLPSIQQLDPGETFLARAIELANAMGCGITILDRSWRLGTEDLLDGERLLVFGDDATCDFMRSFAPGRVSAFGHAVSLTLICGNGRSEVTPEKSIYSESGDLSSPESRRMIIRDQLSLAQRGCLSSRAILAIGGDPATIRAALASAIPDYLLRRPLSTGEKAARAMEEVRLMQNGFALYTKGAEAPGHFAASCGVTIATKTGSLPSLGNDLESGLGQLDFVIPVFILPEMTPELAVIQAASKVLAVKIVSAGEKCFSHLSKTRNSLEFPKDIQLVRAGTLGAPTLDGRHMGRGFFAT
jgi:hypothetical protein